MSVSGGPNIVEDGLVFVLDAANNKSYAGSGTTWTDLSGNNNSGSLTNGPTFNSADGGSIVFDGANDYALITSSSLFNLSTSPFTIECTVKTDTPPELLSSYRRIISIGDGTRNIQLGLGTISPNGLGVPRTFYIINNGATSNPNYITNDGIPFGTINHVVATFNGTSTYNMYLNGVSSSGSYAGSVIAVYLPATNYFTIGQRGDNVGYLSGSLYNVKIYNKALSANEVLQNFNAQRSRFGV